MENVSLRKKVADLQATTAKILPVEGSTHNFKPSADAAQYLNQGKSARGQMSSTFYDHLTILNGAVETVFATIFGGGKQGNDVNRQRHFFLLRHMLAARFPNLAGSSSTGAAPIANMSVSVDTAARRERELLHNILSGITDSLQKLAPPKGIHPVTPPSPFMFGSAPSPPSLQSSPPPPFFAGGRNTSARTVLRRSLLVCLLSGLKKGQYTDAARLLSSTEQGFVLRIETVRQHARMCISDLLLFDEDLQREYINVRGLTRSIGVLSHTPAVVIEACQEYYRSEFVFPLIYIYIYIHITLLPCIYIYIYTYIYIYITLLPPSLSLALSYSYIMHHRSVSVPLPGKYDFVMVNGEKLRKRELHGMFALHHRSFNDDEKKRQKQTWEQDAITLGGPEAIYACSSLLHLAIDYCFVLLSILGTVVQYCSEIHTPLAVVRKRVMPKKKLRKEAVQAVLEARGHDIAQISSDVCSIETGEPVFRVRVHPWVNRSKGIFGYPAEVADEAKATVVPARLVRAMVDPAKIKNERVERKCMRMLYQKCRVFHLSYGKFFPLKPPEVVMGKREGCYCASHLRFEYQVTSLSSMFTRPLFFARLFHLHLNCSPSFPPHHLPGPRVEKICAAAVQK